MTSSFNNGQQFRLYYTEWMWKRLPCNFMLNSTIFLEELMKTKKNISVGISGLRFELRTSEI